MPRQLGGVVALNTNHAETGDSAKRRLRQREKASFMAIRHTVWDLSFAS
jgi:hypothetical protein